MPTLAREHGLAVASQTLRCFQAVYRYRGLVNPELPECPTVVVALPGLEPHDWALSDERLRGWWRRSNIFCRRGRPGN